MKQFNLNIFLSQNLLINVFPIVFINQRWFNCVFNLNISFIDKKNQKVSQNYLQSKLLFNPLIYNIYVKSPLGLIHSISKHKILKQMLSNRQKNQNYSQMQAGQSLFDFLKRKKKFSLETSLSISRHKQNNINNSNSNYNANNMSSTQDRKQSKWKESQNKKQGKQDASPRKKYQNTYKDTVRESIEFSNITRNQDTNRSMGAGQQPNITPRKVSFADERQKKLTARSSFIEMISPMKKKMTGSKTPDHYTAKQVSLEKDAQRPKTPANPQEQFFRKNLNQSVLTLKSTLQKFISLSTTLKQKSHSIFIQLKPLLKLVQQSENPNFAKRAQEVKIKLRSFEFLFKQFSIQNGNQILQQFHRTFSQHLISYQSNLKASFQKQKNDWFNKLKNDKDSLIQQLLGKQQKYIKQIDNLNRKLQKQQKQTQRQKYNSQNTLQKGQINAHTKIINLQNKVKQYQMQINNLAKQLDNSKQIQKNLQKQVKDLKYLKQQAQKRFIQQNIKIKSTKEQFLLNQIAMLKKEFKCDMEQLTQLYSTKQQENLAIIEQLRYQLAQLQKQRYQDKEIESKIVGDAVSYKTQIQKFRKKNQCLVTDLHRMNEQLYQHWLALKDLKTLSVRLQIYNKFSKIYEDLAFNDQLFI